MIRLKVFEIMVKRGIRTRKDLAQATGIHQNSLGRVVNGEVKALRLDTLDRLCQALDCQPGDLLEYVPDEAKTA